MVCDFAYGYHTERLIITKGQYMDRQVFLEESKLASIAPFEHYVNRFLVSTPCFTGRIVAVTNRDTGLKAFPLQRRRSIYQGSTAGPHSGGVLLLGRSYH